MKLPERFWSKVVRRSQRECWLWTGYKNADGYGKFRWQGKSESAHRLSAAHAGMRIKGRVVRHTCDVRACVNWSHLCTGTHGDNVRDRDARGRGRWVGKKGIDNPCSKLTEEQVLAIRRAHGRAPRCSSGKLRAGELKKIVKRFGLPLGTVRNIVDRHQWTHI